MDSHSLEKERKPEEPRYLNFKRLPSDAKLPNGQLALNRYSHTVTNGHDFPGAKAMLYASGVPNEEVMSTAPHIGIASVWWEGNPCNMHLLDLAKVVKKSVQDQGMLGWQYNTIGVSDAITMGGDGMRFSLQSREIIADSIETVTCGQHHDGCIALPGCDKNMPGAVMAFARFNRPSIMIYGGTIKPGYSKLLRKPINISTCYEAFGSYVYDALKNPDDPSQTKDEILTDIEKNACPGKLRKMRAKDLVITNSQDLVLVLACIQRTHWQRLSKLWAYRFLAPQVLRPQSLLRCENAQRLPSV
jgi:dihydroxy-acid dehydratase